MFNLELALDGLRVLISKSKWGGGGLAGANGSFSLSILGLEEGSGYSMIEPLARSVLANKGHG